MAEYRAQDGFGYDAFLSHSHVDKQIARTLHTLLTRSDYNGRSMRPWLDQEVLDPGALASARELEVALDQSKFFVLLQSPEATASEWVQKEVTYFLSGRTGDDVIVLELRPGRTPTELADARRIAWSDPVEPEQSAELLSALQPGALDHFAQYDEGKKVRHAWQDAYYSQVRQVVVPTQTTANSELLEVLLSYDIGDLVEEGQALAAFQQVGYLISKLDLADSYVQKMVLGELLAVAMVRDARYGRVLAQYVARDHADFARPALRLMLDRMHGNAVGPPTTTNLLTAVARADSKLAEVAPTRIDFSTLAAVLQQLDLRDIRDSGVKVVAGMIGRAIGKVRELAVFEVLIRSLMTWGGDASCFAAAGALSTLDHEGDLYFTAELERLNSEQAPSYARLGTRPSAATARLLLDTSSALWQHHAIERELEVARGDLLTAFGDSWPSGDIGEAMRLRAAPTPADLVNGPLIGTIRRATRANMEAVAATAGPADVVCLTEPRIVDVLFMGVSGYLIRQEEIDQSLGVRLAAREARFAGFSQETMRQLHDGDVVGLWPGRDGRSASGFLGSLPS
jgi:hypothetical protein